MYIFHYFTLMYKFCTLFVHFWSCTLMYIGFHQEKNTRDIGSKQASSAPLLLEFPNIEIIWGLKIHLSSVMYCGFQMLLNLLVMKFSIMDPVILSLRLRRLWLKYLASHLPFGDVFIKKSVLLASWSEVIQWPQYKCSFRSSEVEEVFNCRPNLLFKFQSIKAFPQTSCKSLTPCVAELITSGETPSRSSSRLRRSIPSRKS